MGAGAGGCGVRGGGPWCLAMGFPSSILLGWKPAAIVIFLGELFGRAMMTWVGDDDFPLSCQRVELEAPDTHDADRPEVNVVDFLSFVSILKCGGARKPARLTRTGHQCVEYLLLAPGGLFIPTVLISMLHHQATLRRPSRGHVEQQRCMKLDVDMFYDNTSSFDNTRASC